jgi:hypothetical protein
MMLINLTGEPGAGKSTMAAGLFHQLKSRHWNVELVTEYTKELILTGDKWSLADELLVFSEKYRRIKKLESVDIVVTDSPLINSVVYGDAQFGPAAGAFYEEVARSFDNIYFAVKRVVPYIPLGRMPDETQAAEAGETIISHVNRTGDPLWLVEGRDKAIPGLVNIVEKEARRRSINPLHDLLPDQQVTPISDYPSPITEAARLLP